MRRTKIPEKPTALLTSDWHIRESTPVCRMDDFYRVQWGKIAFISELQRLYDCPILFAGDLYDHWKPSPYLLSESIQCFPEKMYCVYGNHDLPQHSLEQSNKCGMFTLETAEKIEMLDECHWNMEPENGSLLYGNPIFPKNINQKVLIWHVMTYPSGKQPWPGCEDLSAGEILDKYPQFDLILCGHNHKTFIEEKDGRLLVNPGSLTRQNADQIDHKPSVFLWYAKSNRVEQVILPHEKNVISREHLDAPKKREGRLRAYIENMNTDWGAAWSFKDNLENHFRKNKSISKKIKDMIWKSIEK